MEASFEAETFSEVKSFARRGPILDKIASSAACTASRGSSPQSPTAKREWTLLSSRREESPSGEEPCDAGAKRRS